MNGCVTAPVICARHYVTSPRRPATLIYLHTFLAGPISYSVAVGVRFCLSEVMKLVNSVSNKSNHDAGFIGICTYTRARAHVHTHRPENLQQFINKYTHGVRAPAWEPTLNASNSFSLHFCYSYSLLLSLCREFV